MADIEYQEARLPAGTIRYVERGRGAPIVFVHGLLVNGALWRKVVPRLSDRFRCIVPDWPLGSHRAAMHADADLSPPGLARIIADFLAALDLDGVTLVGNDTGGALCQLVVTDHPGRIGRMVLTPCDAYENFLPLMIRYLTWTAVVPGGTFLLARSLRLRALRRMPFAYGWLAKHPLEPAVLDAYAASVIADPAVRRDVRKVLRGISPRFTLAAAAKLGSFTRPALIVWAPEDRFFPLAHAERLRAAFPRARLALVDDAYTFGPEDQPDRRAELIAGFAAEPAARAVV